jgi:hypothetical protein
MHFLSPIIICLSLVVFVTPVRAQPQRPERGHGQAIRDKIQEVLVKTQSVGTHLEALCDADCQTRPAGQKFRSKVERMKTAHTRVTAAHGRTRSEDFQEFVRKRPKKKDEGCDPQIQVCVAGQGTGVFASDDPEFDEERGKDMIEDLDEVGAEIDELNSVLAGNVPPPHPPRIALDNAEYFFPDSLRPSPELAYGAFIASQVAQKMSAIASHGCDQTAVALGFGGNASAACIVVEGVFQLLDYVYQVMNYIGEEGMAAEVTGTYKRTKNIFDLLALSGGDIEIIKMIVEAMGQKMLILEQNQKKIIELLSTPQGQRPAFPIKVP